MFIKSRSLSLLLLFVYEMSEILILSLNTNFTQQNLLLYILGFFLTENISLYSKQGADGTQRERNKMLFLCITPLYTTNSQNSEKKMFQRINTSVTRKDEQGIYTISLYFCCLIEIKKGNNIIELIFSITLYFVLTIFFWIPRKLPGYLHIPIFSVGS